MRNSLIFCLVLIKIHDLKNKGAFGAVLAIKENLINKDGNSKAVRVTMLLPSAD
jgi:hypothetical protein